jgi:transcriptional regulator with XRE-family HTH domain
MLGSLLRELRVAAGVSSVELAQRLGLRPEKVSRLEAGNAVLTVEECEAFVVACGVSGGQGEELRALAVEARRRRPYTGGRAPSWRARYPALEARAGDLRTFSPDFVPGPLQTAEYAGAVLSESVIVSAREAESMARDRARRLSRLSPGALLWVVLGEEALRRPVGGVGVQVAQLRHLVDLGGRANITVQVLPLVVGAHVALGLPFTVLALPDGRQVVYLETLTSADYLTRPEQTSAYSLAFGRLQGAALDRAASRTMIQHIIKEMERSADAS